MELIYFNIFFLPFLNDECKKICDFQMNRTIMQQKSMFTILFLNLNAYLNLQYCTKQKYMY